MIIKKYGYILLIMGFIILPVCSVFYRSIYNPFAQSQEALSSITLGWYIKVFSDIIYLKGWFNSLMVACVSSALATTTSLYISRYWAKDRENSIIILFVLILALFPAQIQAIGIKYMFKYLLNIQKSTLSALIYAHILAILPYSFIIIAYNRSMIKNEVVKASNDLGASEIFTFIKVLYPLSRPGIISSFMLGFIISLNEYNRVFYLKGSNRFISEIIYGKMGSEYDPSVYALSSVNIILALGLIIYIRNKIK